MVGGEKYSKTGRVMGLQSSLSHKYSGKDSSAGTAEIFSRKIVWKAPMARCPTVVGRINRQATTAYFREEEWTEVRALYQIS
jgi:hypothetical protein